MGRRGRGAKPARPVLEVIDEYVAMAPIEADVVVRNKGDFVLRSVLRGSLSIRSGGVATVAGRVDEDIEVRRGGRLVVVGVVIGRIRDRGGVIVIDTHAYVSDGIR